MLVTKTIYGYKCDLCGRQGQFSDDRELSRSFGVCSSWKFIERPDSDSCICWECYRKMRKIKRYYSLRRPLGIGTHPKRGLERIENFISRKFCPEIDGEAWGYAEYNRKLTEQELYEYELKPDKNNKE